MSSEPSPAQPFGYESSDSVLYVFTDVAIPFPPGIPASRREREVAFRPSTPDEVERQWRLFRQISDRDLLELWRGHAENELLRSAVLAEANRRAALSANGETSEELNEILKG